MSNKSQYTDKLDFEVSAKPLFVQLGEQNVQKCTDKVAIVNESTNQVLSYMSPNYRLFSNKEFTELSEKISEVFNLPIDHYNSYKGGKKVLAAFRNEGGKKHSICGHEFENHLVMYDSRDGTMCLGGGGVNKLYRCNNLFASTLSNSFFNIRHNKNLDEKLAEFEIGLELYELAIQAKIQKLESFEQVKVSQDNLYQLVGGWVDLTPGEVRDVAYGNYNTNVVSTRKKNIVDGLVNSFAIESAELGSNAWGLYNAVTHYNTHKRGKDEMDIMFADFGKKEKQTIQFCEGLM